MYKELKFEYLYTDKYGNETYRLSADDKEQRFRKDIIDMAQKLSIESPNKVVLPFYGLKNGDLAWKLKYEVKQPHFGIFQKPEKNKFYSVDLNVVEWSWHGKVGVVLKIVEFIEEIDISDL